MSLKLFVCASVLLVCCIQVSIAGTNETDKQALLDIKALIKRDPLGVLSSWNDSLPVCNWYGVQCGLKHARVTLLDLNSSKLSGTISPSIGNLTFLSVLNLKNNSFGGTIPPEIGGLSRLQYLKLNNNSFGGTIPPELGRLYNLEYMSLSYNYLGGELPSNISRCSQLTELHVYQNTLVGQIPPELGSLQYLETLVLSINNFTEYGMGNEVSMGGDVYSFGILVLEMFTGKRPTAGSFKKGRSLRDFVKAGLSEQDIRIADRTLLQDMATEGSDSQLAFEVVMSVFEIALTCCTEVQHERPDISDIVGKLSSVRTKLQGLHMQQQSRTSGSG